MTRPVARVPRQDLAAPQYPARLFELGRARARRDSGVPWRYRWRSGRRTPRGVANLREPPGEDCDSIRDTVFAAAKTVENCLASIRKRHQLSVSQLMIEIRMLHKRIDRLESGASVVMLTHLFPRKGMEQRIREGQPPCQLLLIHAGGMAASQFGCAVAEELTDAGIRRLRNVLPAAAILARWSGEGFLALLEVVATEAAEPALRGAACLDGRCACVRDGKAVHPPVQPEVRLLEPAAVGAEEALRQAGEFLADPGVC